MSVVSTPATVTTPVSFETVADVLERLGGSPPQRIRLKPPPGTATERDVIAIHDRENRLCELVDGILVEKVMGASPAIRRRASAATRNPIAERGVPGFCRS